MCSGGVVASCGLAEDRSMSATGSRPRCPRFRRAGAVVERHWQRARQSPPLLHDRRSGPAAAGAVRLAVVRQRDQCRQILRPAALRRRLLHRPEAARLVRSGARAVRPAVALRGRQPEIRLSRRPGLCRGQPLHPGIFLPDAGNAEHRAVLDADRLHLRLPALLLRGAPTDRQPLAALRHPPRCSKSSAPFPRS